MSVRKHNRSKRKYIRGHVVTSTTNNRLRSVGTNRYILRHNRKSFTGYYARGPVHSKAQSQEVPHPPRLVISVLR